VFDCVVVVLVYDSAIGIFVPFSNCGFWVDVCVFGVDLYSCYVDGWCSVDLVDVIFIGWVVWSGMLFVVPLVVVEIVYCVVCLIGCSVVDVV